LPEMTSLVAAAINAPINNKPKPIWDTADPAKRHLRLNESARICRFAKIADTELNVIRMYMIFPYTFVKYTITADRTNAIINDARVEAQNFLASERLYFKNCVKAV